ncbi:MAG: amidohydrolase family protein [Actinomycetota bacterium]
MELFLDGVTLFDGRTLRSNCGVLISEDRIEWVGPRGRAPKAAAAAHTEPGEGRTLTPGLIDCHVHLTFDGTPDFAGEAADLTPALATIKAVNNAARQLAHGVTTVRDLGGPYNVVPDLAKAISAGLVPGPRTLAAGHALTVTGGHGHNVAFAREVDGPEALRKAVREEIRAGATAIKLVATGGVLTPGIGLEFTAFDVDELRAAVEEAHKWGRVVAAHSIGYHGTAGAVEAGVDSIEHGALIDAATAKRMKEAGTFTVPTLSALLGIATHPESVPAYAVEKARSVVDQAQESFRRVMRAGVRVALGTDAGTPHNPHGNAPHEIVRMVEWGMTPLKAMRAATSAAAKLLRIDDRVGSIAPGMLADIVVYEGEPLEEVTTILQPALVLQAGRVVAGELGRG